jgi:hypothetical protein
MAEAKWEYLVEYGPRMQPEFPAYFNGMGDKGWELVTKTYLGGDRDSLIWKRKKP